MTESDGYPSMAPMPPAELRRCLEIIGWSYRYAAERWNIREQIVRRMAAGERPISEEVALYVRSAAAHLDSLPIPRVQAY